MSSAMAFKILVADDDFDNRTLAKDVLEMSGYQVVLATNGMEALEVAAREKPDLILLDLSMPEMSGWDVAKRIRQKPTLTQTKIVAFTAHALVGDDLDAKEAGCDDYLSKPCDPVDIVRTVAHWLKD